MHVLYLRLVIRRFSVHVGLPLKSDALRLEVDNMVVDAKGVLVGSGWAAGHLDISVIRIFVGDTFVGVADHGYTREDVASAVPEYPNSLQSGFRVNIDVGQLGAGCHSVKVQVTTQGGTTREAVCSVSFPASVATVTVSNDFHFHCDEIVLSTRGRLILKGWAVCAAPTESISVRVDGEDVGLADLEIDRPDVGKVFNHATHAQRAGFEFRARLKHKVTVGAHLVTLTIRDMGDGIREVPIHTDAAEATVVAKSGNEKTAVSVPERVVYLDAPRIVNGAAEAPITNNLSISGWAVAQAGVKSIEIAVDGKPFSSAHHGMRRSDVATRYPDRPDALLSGFAALIPHWSLPMGSHRMTVSVVDRAGESDSIEFGIQVEDVEDGDGPWFIRRTMAQSEIEFLTHILTSLHWKPNFHFFIRMTNTQSGLDEIHKTLAGLRYQIYSEWGATILVDECEDIPLVLGQSIFREFGDIREKIEFYGAECCPSLANILSALEPQSPDSLLLSVLTAGDILGCDALLELAVSSGLEKKADFFYSDERRTSPVTQRRDAFFKPAWSPDLLLSTNYIGRLWLARAKLWVDGGITPMGWLERGDYDLVLLATEQAKSVQHVPKVLCERYGGMDSADQERNSIARALERRGQKAIVNPGCASGTYRIKRMGSTYPKVSLIVPTCARRGLIKPCLDTLKGSTTYLNFEIICIENISLDDSQWKSWIRDSADMVIEAVEPFNWSRYNNLCAARASGEILVFLNDDTEIIDPDWLEILVRQAERLEVGAVGPQLLYKDRSVQHAGLALASLGKARHLFRHLHQDDPGYFGLALTERNVIGITGACLVTRRVVFDAVGGFNEAHGIVNNDLDYCLKTWRHGYVNIFTPHAQLIHHELASRADLKDDYDMNAFRIEWRGLFANGDPYLNPNLSREYDDLVVEREPIQVVHAKRPLLKREMIQKILVVKLDHIGDCLTAIPAVRRLKELFPEARFSILANRATRAIWESEKAIDEIIEFDFFHARSSLGKVEIAETDLLALQQRLKPLGFDLAVDLRKSTDTRTILNYTGARFRAGFDSKGKYPWLDIALEWECDTRYVPKRSHVSDDLLNLVEAIGTSCRTDRPVFRLNPKITLSLPIREITTIFNKRVVCIHPVAGNEMREWPHHHFAEVADLILAHHEVNVIIVGGQDDTTIAEKMLGCMRDISAVHCLVGKCKLEELPLLISKCVLFIGNNSGPKHIAAALGVPTIGVHSGVIDSNEWGPLGTNAVAIRRNMSCSPCYIEKKIDCPRDLACLRLDPGQVFKMASKMLAMTGIAPEDNMRASRMCGLATV